MSTFIGRVVVNVHVGVLRTAFFYKSDELDEGFLFLSKVVGPEGGELAFVINESKEVVEVPLTVFFIEGVALEVEEDVSFAGCRETAQNFGIVHLKDRHDNFVFFNWNCFCGNLELGLLLQCRKCLVTNTGNGCDRS